MENSEDLEDLGSWEVIPCQYVQQQSISSTPLGGEVLGLFVKENFYDESPVILPSEHEGLEVSEEECFDTSSSSSLSACSESEDRDLQQFQELDSWLDVTVRMGRQMRLGISNLSRRIVSATTSFRPCAACRAKTWTLNSVTALMAAMAFTLTYARMNRWHKQVLLISTLQIICCLLQAAQQAIC